MPSSVQIRDHSLAVDWVQVLFRLKFPLQPSRAKANTIKETVRTHLMLQRPAFGLLIYSTLEFVLMQQSLDTYGNGVAEVAFWNRSIQMTWKSVQSHHLEVSSLRHDRIVSKDAQTPRRKDEESLEVEQRSSLVQKQSGEHVKPALRRAAARTPKCPKTVRFNENIQQIRHFYKLDRPSAVSGGFPTVAVCKTQPDSSFPRSRCIQLELKPSLPKHTRGTACVPIKLEQLTFSNSDSSLIGSIIVANIAFEKSVFVRYTLDNWKTTSETAAEYAHTRADDGPGSHDQFRFGIDLSGRTNLHNETLLLCARYNVSGHEYWDNNNGHNYRVGFSPRLPERCGESAGSDRQGTPAHAPTARTQRTAAFETSEGDYNLRTKLGSLPRPPAGETAIDPTLKSFQMPAKQPRVSLVDCPGRPRHRWRVPSIGSAEHQALIQKFCYFGSASTTSPGIRERDGKNQHAGLTTDQRPSWVGRVQHLSGALTVGDPSASAMYGVASRQVPFHVLQLQPPQVAPPYGRWDMVLALPTAASPGCSIRQVPRAAWSNCAR
jgi:hypothetical protein